MKYVLIIVSFFSIAIANAQQKSGKQETSQYPKVSATLGGFKGGKITPELLSQAVDSAIMAVDDKGNKYQIVGFRVFYKFKSTFTDSESGQKKSFDDMRVNEFNTPNMSENWKESIKDNAKAGDEMIVDNIIIKLKSGTKMMTPPLNFKVI